MVRKSEEHVLSSFLRIFPMWAQQSIIPDDAKVHVYKDVFAFRKERESKKEM